MTMLASSGKSGIRSSGSNMAALLGVHWLGTGRRQPGQWLFPRRGWQRFVILNRLDVGFAEVLPHADIQGLAALIKEQDQRQSDGGLAGGDREREQHEDLPLQIAPIVGEGYEIDRHALKH